MNHWIPRPFRLFSMQGCSNRAWYGGFESSEAAYPMRVKSKRDVTSSIVLYWQDDLAKTAGPYLPEIESI